jgi:flagellar biosynthesis protein FlhA
MNQAVLAPPRNPIADALGGGAIIGILALTIVPLPGWALDFLLTINIALSVLIFLLAVYVDKPLDFSAFPSLLLLATLFRLSLGIATTRLILLHGADGHGAAGRIIQAFGQFAIGGNFVVGAVVFLILVIVNFIVITKGADRISEVSARFTLDSMPGKQMAVDAELAAGLINEKEAKARRAEIEKEAEFHGSMDGASKFVRGDAIAGLMIVAINIIGGMIIGVAQAGMSFGDAATTFTLLSIGDGLVSQIPALLVSTGAALLTTRGSNSLGLGGSLQKQLLSKTQAMSAVAFVLIALALVPGMPSLLFLLVAGGAWFLARRTSNPEREPEAEPQAEQKSQPKNEIATLMPVELLSLEVGVELLTFVDNNRGGELLTRISSLRKQIALDLGFIVPPIHVSDDLKMRPDGYRVLLSGNKIGQGEVRVGRLLAIDPIGRALTNIPGEQVREPTFGLPAKWVSSTERVRAEANGATVVEATAVIATHLTEIIRRHAHELLGRKEAQELMDIAGKHHGKVLEELVPHLMPLGEVIKVLRALLQEGVSIRDIRSILECLADNAAQVKDVGELTELVRQKLRRQITSQHLSETGELKAMVLEPKMEDLFRGNGKPDAAQLLSKLTASLEEASRKAAERDEPAVLVVSPDVRRSLSSVVLRHVPGLTVLSYREIDPSSPFVTRLVGQIDGAAKQIR